MLLQKIFHVHRNLAETKAQMTNLHNFRRHLEGVNKATVTADGIAQFDFNAGKFHGHFVAVELPTEDPNQVLFKSTAGNVDVAGLIEFFEIRPGLTEVQVTAEYSISSPLHHLVNLFTAGFDRFLNRQLRRLQCALDGAPMAVPALKKQSLRGWAAQLPLLAH